MWVGLAAAREKDKAVVGPGFRCGRLSASPLAMDRMRPTKIPLSNGAAHSNYGNEPASTTTTPSLSGKQHQEMDSSSRTRTGTATLRSAQIRMDFGEAVRQESLPLTRCKRCGLEFGSASFVIHRNTCLCSRSKRTRAKRDEEAKKAAQTLAEVAGKTGGRDTVVTTTLDSPSLERVAGVRVFGEQCQFCGERFSRHSLQLHMKKCANISPKMYTVKEPDRMENKITSGRQSTKTAGAGRSTGAVPESSVAGAVEAQNGKLVSRNQGSLYSPRNLPRHNIQLKLDLESRPRTRSLDHSTLLEKGLTLPSIDGPRSSLTRCGTCREVVHSGDLLVHKKTCRPSPRTVAKGEITFPSLSPNGACTPPKSQTVAHCRRPPAVVCYVCGREYGTKSIAIHEPQCLKRFEIENRKLPVNERKPLPKRSITTHSAMAEQKLTTGRTRLVQYRNEVLQTTAEDYFQYCYKEWEKDLVLCNKCGRKFAPERHVKHAPRCKAKPLPRLAQK